MCDVVGRASRRGRVMVQPKTQHGLCYAKNRVLHQKMPRLSVLLAQTKIDKNMYQDMLTTEATTTALNPYSVAWHRSLVAPRGIIKCRYAGRRRKGPRSTWTAGGAGLILERVGRPTSEFRFDASGWRSVASHCVELCRGAWVILSSILLV